MAIRVGRFGKFLAGFILGLALAIWGYQLVYDPWAQERFDRSVRETCRLNNRFHRYMKRILDAIPIYGQLIVFAGFLVMNRIRITYFLVGLVVFTHGYAYHSNHMYKSERFGGNQMVVGALFYFALIWTLTIIFFDVDKFVPKLLRERFQSKQEEVKVLEPVKPKQE